MSERKTTPLVEGLGFVDSPRWHGGQLWFADFFSRRVASVDADGRVVDRGYVPGQPSGIGFLPDDTPLVVSTHTREVVSLVDGASRPYVSTAATFDGPLNDMVVDAEGRAFVTPMVGRTGPATGLAPVLTIDDIGVRCSADRLSGPNGLALLDGGRTLLVAETGANRLTAFTVADNGDLHSRRLFAELDGRAPDGICADAEGAIWVGCVFAEQFIRVAPGGRLLEQVNVPNRWAVAPALGGARGNVLFCTTATTSLRQFHRGLGTAAIEVIEVSVPGPTTSDLTRG